MADFPNRDIPGVQLSQDLIQRLEGATGLLPTEPLGREGSVDGLWS